MSILHSLKGMVTPELIAGVAGYCGESNDSISKAIDGIFPSLLSSMMGAKQEDHSMLSGLLSQAGNLGSANLVGNLLSGLTSSNNNAGIGSIGSSLVSGLLGNKMGGAVEMISQFAGIQSGSSSALMSIGGSLLASFLGEKMIGEGLHFGSIMHMITGQKDEIINAAPVGFASTLGLGNLFGNASAKVTDAASNLASATTSATGAITGGNDGDNKGGGMKWLLPLILLASIGAAAWWLINKDKNTNASAPAEQTTNSANGIPTSDATVNTTDTARVAADANKQNTAEPVIDAEKEKQAAIIYAYHNAEGYAETLAVVAENASDNGIRADRRTAVRILEKYFNKHNIFRKTCSENCRFFFATF